MAEYLECPELLPSNCTGCMYDKEACECGNEFVTYCASKNVIAIGSAEADMDVYIVLRTKARLGVLEDDT